MDLAKQMLFDISPRLSTQTKVFPGDTPLSQEVLLAFDKGNNLRLSCLKSTVHLGAHADAPSHYSKTGADISEVNISHYIGYCEVVRAEVQRGQRVGLENLIKNYKPQAQRVLICTRSFPDPEKWNSDFCSLEPELIRFLAKHGVVLVGIDTPSIDPECSKELEAHAAVSQNQMSILEGLVLDHVAPGLYNLVALPLPLKDFDASPVRAVLLSSHHESS